MKMTIAERLRPFSHTPGSMCIIPKTHSVLQAFPTKICLGGEEIKLQVLGPVDEFTLEQNLEKGCVFIYGKAKSGYFKIHVFASSGGFHIVSEKGRALQKPLFLPKEISFIDSLPIERLSLGNHKSQDWDQVQKRADLKEFFPTLFALGQLCPHVLPQPLTGTARLLEVPEDRTKLEAHFKAFFKAAFKSLLVPRLVDDQHQGLCPDEKGEGNPLFLIQEGAKIIRSLFFKQNERRLAFLPHLPISLDCGRMLHIQAPGVGEIDFEWTKKTLRRVVFRKPAPGEVILELPKEIKSFRVNKKQRQASSEPLLLSAGKTFFLDQFKK